MSLDKEINENLKNDGYPPIPRTDSLFADDEINFKKFIVTPQEPIEYIKDEKYNPPRVYELPRYTPTMALGNLDTDKEAAMRDDFHMFSILSRYGYNNRAKQCMRDITDRIISSQSHLGKMIDNVTEQHFSMRREEYPIMDGQNNPEAQKNPIQKIMEGMSSQPAKTQQSINEQDARFR